jgi:hypothetical protein
MNQKVSPAVAGVVVIALIAIIAFVGFRMLGGTHMAGPGEKPPGMPADAAAEFQKRLGTSTPTSAGNRGPGPGAPGVGYIAPPTPGR